MRDKLLVSVAAALSLYTLSACQPIFFSIGLRSATHLERAEALSSDGRFEEAIDEYRRHIDYRLALDNRPDWENPYLYYLLIGDLELNRGRPDEALLAYEAAESRGVDSPLVSDRYRYAASWYEKRGQLDKALEILTRYRDRDPLLMDSARDRIAKEIVRGEEGGASETEESR